MFSGIRLTKFKDKLVPDTVWEHVLKQNFNVYGAAFTQDGFVNMSGDTNPTLEALVAAQSEFASFEMQFFFGRFSEGFSEEDLQPYVIISDDKANVSVAAIIEGDYSNHAMAGSTRAPEFFAVENGVTPAILELWDLVEGDMDKIAKALGNVARKQAFDNLSATRGDLTLILGNGSVHYFGKQNPNADIFEWGTMSNTLGYREGSFPSELAGDIVEQEIPVPELTSAQKLKALMSGNKVKGIKPVSTPTAVPVTPAVAVVPKPTQASPPPTVLSLPAGPVADPAKSTVPKVSQTEVEWDIPKQWTNHTKKSILLHAYGVLPENWKSMTVGRSLLTRAPRGVATRAVKLKLDDLKTLQTSTAVATAPKATEAEMAAVEKAFQKDVTTTHVDATPTDQPLIPVAQRKAFKETFLVSVKIKELRDKYTSPVPSMEEFQKLEKHQPSFSEQTGLNIEETFRYDHTDILLLVKQYPDLAAVLLETYRIGYMKQWKPKQVQQQESPPVAKVKGIKPVRIAATG